MKNFALLLCCMTLLCSCIKREQADLKLFKGCQAAAELFIDEGTSIKKVKQRTSKPSPEFGQRYRDVMIFVIESDGWAELDKEYHCIFAEEFTPFNTSHSATLYQLNVNGKTYGQKDGTLVGELSDHIRINDAVTAAMR